MPQKNSFDSKIKPNLGNILRWAKNGTQMQDIAKKLGITYKTFHKYLHAGRNGDPKYAEFAAIFEAVKALPIEEQNAEVLSALFKLCTGHVQMIDKPIKVRKTEIDPKTGRKMREWEEVEQTTEQVYTPPNIAAISFWLINKLSEEWQRDPHRRQLDINTDSGGIVFLPTVDTDLTPPVENEADNGK